jgi:hypothetical protein
MTTKASPRKTGQRKVPNVNAHTSTRIDLSSPVQEQIALLAWEHEKLKYEVKVAFLQMQLANPQVQQALAARMAQEGQVM